MPRKRYPIPDVHHPRGEEAAVFIADAFFPIDSVQEAALSGSAGTRNPRKAPGPGGLTGWALAFVSRPQEVRRLIYTPNTIEGFNHQLRKVTKAKSVFPTDESLLKLLYLAMMNSTKK